MTTTYEGQWQERTAVLLGDARLDYFHTRHILIVGVGGVGGAAAEMLCRAGIGRLTLIDADTIAESNINRQLIATHRSVGETKVTCFAERLRDINPAITLDARATFITPDTIDALLDEVRPDFVIDAIDTLQPKVALIATCIRRSQPIITSLGAGAKSDITQIKYADLWKTHNCTLGKMVRKGLTKEGLRWKRVPAVFSSELPDEAALIFLEGERNKKTSAGTISYMPNTFGCYLAAYVLKHL
ncbi:MAG: tRNA threonylcarbamoyladenosine dehydratase [Bacteroidales bacterium]|nr:tRNA threonylcarbamoyladenosine dehydratase [Bacteroidales bacterium]